MQKKIRVTSKEIEQDIIGALKNPPESPKSKSPWWITACVFAGIVLIEIFCHSFMLFALLSFFVLIPIHLIGAHLLLKYRINRVSIHDYEIKSAIVSDTYYETYTIGAKHRKKIIQNYEIRFEGGKVWRIPNDNYLWCEEHPMSEWAIYQATHRGDEYIIVVKRKSEKVVMGYPTAIFEYRQ